MDIPKELREDVYEILKPRKHYGCYLMFRLGKKASQALDDIIEYDIYQKRGGIYYSTTEVRTMFGKAAAQELMWTFATVKLDTDEKEFAVVKTRDGYEEQEIPVKRFMPSWVDIADRLQLTIDSTYGVVKTPPAMWAEVSANYPSIWGDKARQEQERIVL